MENISRKEREYRESFSARICDDLCEVLLSYLSIEDKIKFECISKQFQRCVFIKQNTLEIKFHNISMNSYSYYLIKKSKNKLNSYKRQITGKSLECILKKCENINNISITTQVSYDISLEDKEEILRSITINCNRLKSIGFDFRDISYETLTDFGLKFGQKLRKISFYGINYIENYKFLLKLCPNIESVFDVRIEDLIERNEVLVNKLNEVSLCDITTELVESFNQNFNNRLKYLGLNFDELDVYIESMKLFSNLKNLEHLRIDFILSDNTNTPFEESLKQMAINSPKLKKFDLYFTCRYFFPESDILKNIHYFSRIEALVLDFIVIQFNGSIRTFNINCLNGCKLLTSLKLRHPVISDLSFENINLFLPKLRHLYMIESGSQTITDNTFDYLAKLNKLKVILYESFESHEKLKITDSGLCNIINNCSELESICLKRGPNITHKTIDALIALSLRKPRICFNHFFGSVEEKCKYYPVFDMKDYKNLPKNLNLIVSRDKDTDDQFNKYNFI